MIIDLILDRWDGYYRYSADRFYRDVRDYDEIFDGIGKNILMAMDYGTEDDVRGAIIQYLISNEYCVNKNNDLCKWVNSVNWIHTNLRVCPHCLMGIECHEGSQARMEVWVDEDDEIDSKCDWCEESGFDMLYELV